MCHIGLLKMNNVIAKMHAKAAIENEKVRKSWGQMYHQKSVPTHTEKFLDLSKNAKRVNLMLKRGRDLGHIAKQMRLTKQTIGQIVSVYKLPREE